MKLISDKSYNYPFAGIVWIVFFLLFYFLCSYVGLDGKLWTISSFISGAIVAFGDRTMVPLLNRGLLTFNGEEAKDSDGKSVWLDSGMYFTFWIFKVSLKESHSTEENDVIVPVFDCQDRTGKGLKADANGGYEIPDNLRDNYKMQNEHTIKSDLSSLIRQTTMRICGSEEYLNGLLGKDIGLMIRNDYSFQCETGRYGVSFHKMHVTVVSANLSQDDFNAQFDRLVEREKAAYGPNYHFSHKELQDIKDDVKVRLNRSKQIISNSPMVGRFDVDGH